MARTKEFQEEVVLDKAIALFWCKGFNAASAQDLVDCLGISRSSLYDTFGDKRSLFIAALKRYREQQATALIAMLASSSGIKKTIRDLFKYAISETLQYKLHKGCFIVNSTIEVAPTDKDVAALVTRNMQYIEEAFYTAIKKGQALGEISESKDARALARFFFNNITGIRVAAKIGADEKIYEDILTIVLSTLD